MPLYEYFCPECFVELELFQPISRAQENSICPSCGAVAWRLVSGFSSKTGSYLQGTEQVFREEVSGRPSVGVVTATAAGEVAEAEAAAENEPATVAVEVSWLTESQPNGSNLWFIHNWGIASLLRYLREEAESKPAEGVPYPDAVADTRPAEDYLKSAPGADQRIGYPSVRPWPEERITEPVTVMEPRGRAPEEAAVVPDRLWWPESYVRPWPEEEPQPAPAAQPTIQPSDQPAEKIARPFWPRSYFGWFLLITVCLTAISVPLIWIVVLAT